MTGQPSFAAAVALGGADRLVCLAMQEAEVYLLDDFTSKMDAETAESITSKVLLGPLMDGKTILVVSSLAKVVQMAAKLIWVQGGSIQAEVCLPRLARVFPRLPCSACRPDQ